MAHLTKALQLQKAIAPQHTSRFITLVSLIWCSEIFYLLHLDELTALLDIVKIKFMPLC